MLANFYHCPQRKDLNHGNAAWGRAGAGATFSDVVRLRFYLARYTPEKIDEFLAAIDSVEELGLPHPLPPLSAIGVDYVFEPDVLVEVEVDAVLD